MKTIKYTIAIVLLLSIAFSGFAFTPQRIEPLDIRSKGMGGSYRTDSESFYTLFSNPAGLAFSGDKTLWPVLAVEMGGSPIIFDFFLERIKNANHTDGYFDSATVRDLLNKVGDSGYSMNARIAGPTFGAIRNNFGWGLVSTSSFSAQVPTIKKSDINLVSDVNLVFGYALPLDLGFLGKLSVGFSSRLIGQFESSYKDSVTELININFDMSPMNVSFGVGLDLGVQYELLNFINVALVWQDVYTPVWTTHFVGAWALENWNGTSKYQVLDSKLALGLGMDIPIEVITANIISHLGIYADYDDIFLLAEDNGILGRNPILGLSVGAELILFDIIGLRAGMNEMYPSAGIGLYFPKFAIDFAIYGKELGLEPGYRPELNMGLSFAVQY